MSQKFTIVEKSSAECNKLNAANKELIDLGLSNPLKPSEAVLQSEKLAVQRKRLEADNAKQFAAHCKTFLDAVLNLSPQNVIPEATVDEFGLRFQSLRTCVKVEVYTPYRYGCDTKTLRVVITTGWSTKSKIYKSKTQDISKLAFEVELIKKVSDEVNSRVARELAIMTHDNEAARKSKAGGTAFEQNLQTFKAVGASDYNMSADGPAITCEKLTITATLDQWKQIAAILK